VTLGGRRVPVSRPRLRSADDSVEVGLASYAEFAARDLLERVALERMLARVSTRRYGRAAEPVGADVESRSRSTSKSAVSRAFVRGTRTALDELLSRELSGLELAVVMIDGLELAGMTHVVALGITPDGSKVPLSLREGSTENATVATALLSDLVERGLRLHEQQLFVLDGAKALRKAVRDVAGARAPVQRCHRHKECHEGVTSAVAASLEGFPIREERRHAAVCWDRLGHEAGAMVRGHPSGRVDRRGLVAGGRGRPGVDGRSPRPGRCRLPGDDERRGVGP